MGKGDHTKDRERDSRKLQIIRQHASSVSRALWPSNIQQSDALGKFAQRKKSSPVIQTWNHLREYCAYLRFRLLFLFSRASFACIDANTHSKLKHQRGNEMKVAAKAPLRTHARFESRHSSSLPETPMPSEPLIRVLETFDLSQSDIEHFLNGEENQLVGTHIKPIQSLTHVRQR
jgi:hypothetical protein